MDDTRRHSENHFYDRFFKICSIISFFLILIVLAIILSTEPASSYEFSIYDVYPGYFWAFLLSAIICGIGVIFGSLITRSKKNYWLFGLCAILITNVILLFSPVIRGYYIYGSGDVLTHIGSMKEILRTSSIGNNYYPIDHLLGVIIHVISGFSLPDVTLIIPPIFSFFFILSMYFVGKTISHNKFEQMILIILSSILMWGNGQLSFVPNAQAFFLVPLFLYLALKMYGGVNTIVYHILLLLLGFLIVFYHPLVTAMIILILCLMQILQYILEKFEKSIVKKVNYTYSIFFILAVFSIWSTYLNMVTSIVRPIIGRLLGDENTVSELQKNIDLLSQVKVDPMYVVKLIIDIYGKSILFGILALLSIGLILISMKNQKIKPNFYYGISVMGFIVIFLLSMAMFVTNGAFGFGRIYSFATIFSLLLIPTGIYFFLFNTPKTTPLARKNMLKLLGVFFIFFCITYFSLFSLYLSPLSKSFNQQVSRSDYIGMSTFFSYRDESFLVWESGPTSNRFYDAIYGPSAPRSNIYFYTQNNIPPDHFGYLNETVLNNSMKNSKYLLVDDLGRGFYPHVYPEFKNNWHFLAQDFEQLKSDTKVQQVYSNRNLEIFVLS